MTNLKSTADAVTRKEVQLPGTSMPDSKQMDDDCVSEDSFGSDFDNATGEENFKARLDGTDTELDLPPPVYSEEGHPRSMDVKPPPIVLQYTPPTGSTEIEPAPSVTPNLSRPLMCVVRGLMFNPMLIPINWYFRSARLHLPIIIQSAGHINVLPKCERFLLLSQTYHICTIIRSFRHRLV